MAGEGGRFQESGKIECHCCWDWERECLRAAGSARPWAGSGTDAITRWGQQSAQGTRPLPSPFTPSSIPPPSISPPLIPHHCPTQRVGSSQQPDHRPGAWWKCTLSGLSRDPLYQDGPVTAAPRACGGPLLWLLQRRFSLPFTCAVCCVCRPLGWEHCLPSSSPVLLL